MKTAWFKKTFLVCLSLALAACADSKRGVDNEYEGNPPEKAGDCTPGEYSAGIVNGKTVGYGSWLEKSTVYVISRVKDEKETILTGECTATLVSPNVLLTAAHCVLETRRNMKPGTSFGYAVFGANPACQPEKLSSRQMYFRDVIVHPEFSMSVAGANDLALIRLEKAIPKEFRPIQVINSFENKKLSDLSTLFLAAGYGRTEGYEKENRFAPRLRVTEMKYLPSEEGQAARDLVFDQSETGWCAGDSGGPIYARIGKKTFLAGVISAVRNEKGKEACSGVSFGMSIDSHREFLRKAFEKIAPREDKNPF